MPVDKPYELTRTKATVPVAQIQGDHQGALFDMPPDPPRIFEKPPGKILTRPVWTENKGLLVAEYLSLFLFVTRRGTYIDGFGGPQSLEHPKSWAARLVLSLNIEGDHHFFLNRFHLFDISELQVKRLGRMVEDIGGDQDVRVWPAGDFNRVLDQLLVAEQVPKQPTFCLLDQRTFECEWSTLERLAGYKDPKIELLYFMPEGWLDRSLASATNPRKLEQIERWWGGTDWDVLRTCTGYERAQVFVRRFKEELGYRHVFAYPIKDRDPQTGGEGRTMYFMVHCSDHDEAPKFMQRAYEKSCRPMTGQRALRLKV